MRIELEPLEILTRLLVASILGLIIGLERNIHGRPAGLRTHLLVSLGSANFVILSALIPSWTPDLFQKQAFYFDPARIAAQIVTGIGFLGAGVIIKDGLSVRGLTTAACLWVSAGIGMASGSGHFMIAFIVTAISLGGLLLFQYLELLYKKDSYYVLVLDVKNSVDIPMIQSNIKNKSVPRISYSYERNYKTDVTRVRFNLNIRQKKNSETVITKIIDDIEKSDLDIISIKWHKG